MSSKVIVSGGGFSTLGSFVRQSASSPLGVEDPNFRSRTGHKPNSSQAAILIIGHLLSTSSIYYDP